MMKRLVMAFLILFTISACVPSETVKHDTQKRPTKVAIALGAGASKGFAHIGVLKVLEMHKVPIDMIVGTSAGSVVGSLYASGLSAIELQQLALKIQKSDVVDLTIPDNGFIKGDKLQEYINRLVKNASLERLKIPFYAVATDIQTGQEIVFAQGNTGMAVRASCAIPGIFRPVKIDSKMYVDGGVVSPVAVDAALKHGADFVIAVDISGDTDYNLPKTTLENILQSINIMYSKIAQAQLVRANIVIKPKVGHIASADFAKRHEAILAGEQAALEALPAIKMALGL